VTAVDTKPIEMIDPTRYYGADWLRGRGITLSPLGEKAANLLGWVYRGIYHMPTNILRAKWDDPRFVEVILFARPISTFDDDSLTRLVVGAHDLCLRVEIQGASPHCLRLWFSERSREGRDIYHYHPTIEEAVQRVRRD
jgi:hypothetical protein